MTASITLMITDDTGFVISRNMVRQQSVQTAEQLITWVATELLRYRGEIWAAEQVTISIERGDCAALRPWPVEAPDPLPDPIRAEDCRMSLADWVKRQIKAAE